LAALCFSIATDRIRKLGTPPKMAENWLRRPLAVFRTIRKWPDHELAASHGFES